ncbi:S-layer homology domain-containing protein [Fervidobacterium islandicum]|uniref:S-layer homology domain-containing protein n=1 Tax=Fervidobacterium islandicum TaxID=2423 RepID=UPI003A674C4F
MRKVLALLAVIVLVTFSMAAFRDIPKGHWAESFVTRLEEAGIATGFPDGTYRGDEAITRYQIAVFLVRTLDYVFQTVDSSLVNLKSQFESDAKKLENDINAQFAAVKQDIEELQIALEDAKLVLELHDQDIIKLYDLVNSLQDKFVYTDDEGNQQEVDLAALKSDVQTISEILNGLAAQLGDVDYLLRKQIADTNKDLSSQIAEVKTKVDAIDLGTKVDKEVFEGLVSRVELLEEYVNMVYETLGTKVSSDEFESVISELDARISELETQVLNIKSTLDTGLPAIRDMVYELYNNIAALEERVTSYTDVRIDELYTELQTLKDDIELNAAKLAELEETVANNYATLEDAILGLYEELNAVNNSLSSNVERVEVLEERLNLVENQVASLDQIVNEVKADKSEVQEVSKKIDDLKAEKAQDVSRLEQMAMWGIGLGIIGVIVGIVGWFRP